jgi:hypothetical protein
MSIRGAAYNTNSDPDEWHRSSTVPGESFIWAIWATRPFYNENHMTQPNHRRPYMDYLRRVGDEARKRGDEPIATNDAPPDHSINWNERDNDQTEGKSK